MRALSEIRKLALLLGIFGLAGFAQILTPPPGPQPRINGARVFGVRPGRPVLYKIAVTGQRPISFRVRNLPAGLRLSEDGIITGTLSRRGKYNLQVEARNAAGSAVRELRIIVGDRIALTPPMGWNSWYVWSESVSDAKMRDAADALIKTGLADHGWTYVNIDDCWEGLRGGHLNAIQGNERFPDMAGLAAYIHSKGLKAGIYSTPWISTYGGFIGGTSPAPDGKYDSLAFPAAQRPQPGQLFGRWPDHKRPEVHRFGPHWLLDRDVRQFAEWGYDYVKYDWDPNDVPTTARIAAALQSAPHDIVLSLSNAAPFEHAADWAKLSNLWRTTGDIQANWASVSRIGFSQDRWAPFAGPGHWNDPDMLQVGWMGVTNTYVMQLKKTALTPDEQYTQVSLWSLLSAPLLLSCDLSRLDDFTLSLLTNDEVLEVDQDPLGKPALPVMRSEGKEVWVKTLEDGSLAVGLFNRGDSEAQVSVPWSALKVDGKRHVRDLWRQKDLGEFAGSFSSRVNAHGVVLVRVSAAAPKN